MTKSCRGEMSGRENLVWEPERVHMSLKKSRKVLLLVASEKTAAFVPKLRTAQLVAVVVDLLIGVCAWCYVQGELDS